MEIICTYRSGCNIKEREMYALYQSVHTFPLTPVCPLTHYIAPGANKPLSGLEWLLFIRHTS